MASENVYSNLKSNYSITPDSMVVKPEGVTSEAAKPEIRQSKSQPLISGNPSGDYYGTKVGQNFDSNNVTLTPEQASQFHTVQASPQYYDQFGVDYQITGDSLNTNPEDKNNPFYRSISRNVENTRRYNEDVRLSNANGKTYRTVPINGEWVTMVRNEKTGLFERVVD